MQAHPFRVEFGVGLTRSAPLGAQELLQIKGYLAFEHKIDCPGEFVRQDTQGFAFAMLFLQPGSPLWSGLMPAQA